MIWIARRTGPGFDSDVSSFYSDVLSFGSAGFEVVSLFKHGEFEPVDKRSVPFMACNLSESLIHYQGFVDSFKVNPTFRTVCPYRYQGSEWAIVKVLFWWIRGLATIPKISIF